MRPGQFTRKWHRLDPRLIQLVGEGKGPDEIAAELRVTRDAVIQRATTLRQRGVSLPKFKKPPRAKVGRPTPPNVIPLVERAVATDPAGAHPPRVRRRSWPVHVAAYVAHVELGYSLRSVGALIGRDFRIVRYAVRHIEDRRDDPAFDAFLERLGEQARELAA